jgi:hypothetical protein
MQRVSVDLIEQPMPIQRRAFSVDEFCAAYRISRRMYFRLRDAGLGPIEMHVGRRVLVSVDAALAWAKAREDTP